MEGVVVERLRERAVLMITQQEKINRIVRACRLRCLAILLVAFGCGFAIGASMPFQLTAVPIAPVPPNSSH